MSLISKLNMFACQRARCLLTVRRCSSVEKQLPWLDSNGKHMVRLVTKLNTCYGLYGTPYFVPLLKYESGLSFRWWSSTLVLRLVKSEQKSDVFGDIPMNNGNSSDK